MVIVNPSLRVQRRQRRCTVDKGFCSSPRPCGSIRWFFKLGPVWGTCSLFKLKFLQISRNSLIKFCTTEEKKCKSFLIFLSQECLINVEIFTVLFYGSLFEPHCFLYCHLSLSTVVDYALWIDMHIFIFFSHNINMLTDCFDCFALFFKYLFVLLVFCFLSALFNSEKL